MDANSKDNGNEFDRSFEASALIDIFAALKPGEAVSYDKMQAAMNGVDPQSQRGRGYVHTAIRRVLKDSQIQIECDWGKGYYHATPDQNVNARERGLRKGRRHFYREAKRGAVVDVSQLSNEGKLKHFTTQSFQAGVLFMSKKANVKKITQAVEQSQGLKKIPAEQTLALFNGNGKKET